MSPAFDSLLAMLGLFPYFLEALALFFLGKFVFDLTTPGIRDDEELGARRNPAFGVFWGGYMLGLGLAIAGSLASLGPSLVDNLLDVAVSGLSAIILLRASMLLGEKFILRGFNLSDEIVRDRNLGAGFAFAGLFVASGLVLAGVMTGRSDSLVLMLRDIVVYWAAGQVLLVCSWLAFSLLAGYDVRHSIGQDNNGAAGLGLGGFFAAMGIVLKAALTNAGSDLGAELLITLIIGAVGLLFLSLAKVLSAFVLLPRLKLREEVSSKGNVAAGIVSATTYIAVAVLLGALVASQLL